MVGLLGAYKFNYLSGKEGYDVDGNKVSTIQLKEKFNDSSSEINQNTKNLSWEQMITKIKEGQYTSMFQGHDKVLKMQSKDGFTYQATQPKIDAFMEVLKDCKNCPNVPIAME
jgi:hypothetical protein